MYVCMDARTGDTLEVAWVRAEIQLNTHQATVYSYRPEDHRETKDHRP